MWNYIQVTFFEKGTKMTSQLHIWKFEILIFSNKIHKTNDFLSLMHHDTNFWTEKLWNILFLCILLKKLRISNFEMWTWDVIFVPFSKKVTCNDFSKAKNYRNDPVLYTNVRLSCCVLCTPGCSKTKQVCIAFIIQ